MVKTLNGEYNNLSNMLEKKIKRTLIETKTIKEKLLIEENLVRSRILMIVESEDNIKNFNKLPKIKQEKIAYSLLEEINFLSENNILNEQLMDALGKIFGSSLSGIVQTIVEPMVSSLLSKLGLGGFFNNFLTSFLVSKPQRLALALKDCKELTKLITEALSEALVKMLQEKTGMEGAGYDFMRNALGDAIKETTFMSSLENQLSGIVCDVFGTFTKKATKVYDKLKPEVTK
jgi:hypothetical protein